MPETDTTDGLDKARQIALLIETLAGIALTAWFVWDASKDDPLGLPAQVSRWWEERRARAARRRRERIELAELAIDIDLFLVREIERWKHHA